MQTSYQPTTRLSLSQSPVFAQDFVRPPTPSADSAGLHRGPHILREHRPPQVPAQAEQHRAHAPRSSSVSLAVQPQASADPQVRIFGSPKREAPLLGSQDSRQAPLLRSYSTKTIHVQSPVSVHTAPSSQPSHQQFHSYYLPPFPAVQHVLPSYQQSQNFFPTFPQSLPLQPQSAFSSHPNSYEPIRISTVSVPRPLVAASLARQSRDSEVSVSLSTAQYSSQRPAQLRGEVRSEAFTVGPGDTPRSVQGAPVLAESRQSLQETQKRLVLLAMENGRLAAKGQDYETAFVEMRARINTLEVQLHDHERLATDFGRLKERHESLEARMQDALEERTQFLEEIEQLQAASRRSHPPADSGAEQLREQARRLAEENDALGRKATLLVAENARLQSITHENEDLRAQADALARERDALFADLRALAADRDALAARAAAAAAPGDEAAGLRNQVAMLVAENELLQSLRPEVESLKDRLARADANQAALLRENAESRQPVQQGSAGGHAEREVQARLEAPAGERTELETLRGQVGELQAENAHLRHELSASRVEFEQIVLDLDRKLQATALQGGDLEPLKRSVGALSHERDELHRSLVQAQNEFNRLEARNKVLQTELENERKTLAVLHQRCELYEKDSQELRARLQEPRPLSRSGDFERPPQAPGAPEEVQAQLEELGEENSQLKAEITDLDDLLLNKDRDIEEVTKYSKYLEGELGAARSLLAEKEQEIGKLVDEVKLLQQRSGSSRSPDNEKLLSAK